MLYLLQQPITYFVLMLILFIIFHHIQNNWLIIKSYEIQSKKIPYLFNGYKIVQISDLHSKCFGKENEKLINKINNLKPDIIVITGDVMNNKKDDGHRFLELAEKLVTKYKLFYIIGNHEQNAALNDPVFLPEYIKKIKDLGVKVLDNEKIELHKNTLSINLYGMWLDLQYYRNLTKKDDRTIVFKSKNVEQSLGRCNRLKYNILLVHNPMYFKAYTEWGADLVLAGHVHGGVVRLPFIGGVLSPERVFFPKYSDGEYNIGESSMIVNRGLGDSSVGIRVFNRPEISLIILRSVK